MNRRLIVAATIATAVGVAGGNIADAHYTTVSCQSPGVWLLGNSEAAWSENFTTDQGHSGTIPAGGTVYVNYSGTSLTVYGHWPKNPGPGDDVTHTAVGEGDCTDNTTTTTSEVTTSTTSPPTSSSTTEASTTTVVTTTQPASTTTSTMPTSSTTPATSTSPTSTTVASSTTTNTSPPSVPSTTQPPESSTTSLPTSTSSEPPPSTPSPPTPPPALPPTGLTDTAWYFAAIAALCVTLGALTVRWNRSGR